MGGDERVAQADARAGRLGGGAVPGLQRRLEAAERGERAVGAAVAGGLVDLEVGAPRRAAGEVAAVPFGEEGAVGGGVHVGDVGRILGRDRPADVVVAAQVGGPGGAAEDGGEVGGEHVLGQRGLAGGEAGPELHHQAVVVGEVALAPLVAAGAQIGDEVGRPDDRLRLEDDRGRGDAGGLDQRLQDVVHLGQVLAGRAHALPHEGDRIQAEHLDAAVRLPEDGVEDGEEDLGVGPVEVPLEGVERGPDAAPVRQRGEVAGGLGGEDLGQGLLVAAWGGVAGREDVVERLGLRIARGGAGGPVVLGRGVVEHHVDAGGDAGGAQGGAGGLEIAHGAEGRVGGAVVHDRVAAVAVARARAQERHHVGVGDAEGFQVGDALGHAGERAGEAVHVEHVADHALGEEPVGGDVAGEVEAAQVLGPLGGVARQERAQAGLEGSGVAVEAAERGEHVGRVPRPAHLEELGVGGGDGAVQVGHGADYAGAARGASAAGEGRGGGLGPRPGPLARRRAGGAAPPRSTEPAPLCSPNTPAGGAPSAARRPAQREEAPAGADDGREPPLAASPASAPRNPPG